MKIEKVFGTYENVTANREAICENYHHWYWKTEVHDRVTWRGVKTLKLVSDMWLYQEIIEKLQPSLIIEFGIFEGGSTLFFNDLLKNMGGNRTHLAVDISLGNCNAKVSQLTNVHFMECSSAHESVAQKISELRAAFPGPVFCILDSDHTKAHVLAEMELLRPLLVKNDYLVIEDSNLGGQPVAGEWINNSPFDARADYMAKYPHDYSYDTVTEEKFGLTYSPKGFLIRN